MNNDLSNKTAEDPTGEVIARLRQLDAANVGQIASHDEWISAVCESAIEELERLRARVAELEAEAEDEHDRALEWKDQMDRLA